MKTHLREVNPSTIHRHKWRQPPEFANDEWRCPRCLASIIAIPERNSFLYAEPDSRIVEVPKRPTIGILGPTVLKIREGLRKAA